VGLVVIVVVISAAMEPLVAFYHLFRDILFFGVWTVAKRRRFKLTHHGCAEALATGGHSGIIQKPWRIHFSSPVHRNF
jgi:hypothetical protein